MSLESERQRRDYVPLSREEQVQRFEEALDALAHKYVAEDGGEAGEQEEDWVVSWRDLGIFFKAPTLVVFMVSFARRMLRDSNRQLQAQVTQHI